MAIDWLDCNNQRMTLRHHGHFPILNPQSSITAQQAPTCISTATIASLSLPLWYIDLLARDLRNDTNPASIQSQHQSGVKKANVHAPLVVYLLIQQLPIYIHSSFIDFFSSIHEGE